MDLLDSAAIVAFNVALIVLILSLLALAASFFVPSLPARHAVLVAGIIGCLMAPALAWLALTAGTGVLDVKWIAKAPDTRDVPLFTANELKPTPIDSSARNSHADALVYTNAAANRPDSHVEIGSTLDDPGRPCIPVVSSTS